MVPHRRVACLVKSQWCKEILFSSNRRATVRHAKEEAKIVDSQMEVARQGLVEEVNDRATELQILVVDKRTLTDSNRLAHLSRI